LQILIFITGNYAFFNLLTIAICLFGFDDQLLGPWVQERPSQPAADLRVLAVMPASRFATAGPAIFGIVIVTLGLAHLQQTFTGKVILPLREAIRYTAPLNIVNTYGLFAVMTTVRNEIEIEGSDDGQRWLAYELPYKPRDIQQAPRWAAPYQPRLDWQLWFAALSNYQQNPWFVGLAIRLLQGSPPVVSLFRTNPFPVHPPRYVRATVAGYTFTDWDTHRRTGGWWKREPLGTYLPPVGLQAAPGN
jgi:lipase maturation factor 1